MLLAADVENDINKRIERFGAMGAEIFFYRKMHFVSAEGQQYIRLQQIFYPAIVVSDAAGDFYPFQPCFFIHGDGDACCRPSPCCV